MEKQEKQREENFVGVVVGGYKDEIETDKTVIGVHPAAINRNNLDLCLGTILRIETEALSPSGETTNLISYGVVEDFLKKNGEKMEQASSKVTYKFGYFRNF